MSEAATRVVQLYKQAFDAQPSVVSRAPGRVEVLGNHTDYNQGYVLSCAIDREIYVAIGPPAVDGQFEFVSTHFPTKIQTRLVEPSKELAWANYPLGVFAALSELGLGLAPFRLAVHGTIPLGAGLSSSAALEISTALALLSKDGLVLANRDIALACQKAENTFTGAQCGLLDQLSSLFGKEEHFLSIDFRTLEHRLVRVPDPSLRLVLTLSGVTHSLAESEYNQRRIECTRATEAIAARDPGIRALRDVSMERLLECQDLLDPTAMKRARHIVGENERVQKGIELLEAGDPRSFGGLLYESHSSSVDNFENSCPELDTIVHLTTKVAGVYGGRLTGGGFGGATLTLLPEHLLPEFEMRVGSRYRTPDGQAPEIYCVRIADGAKLLHGPELGHT